MKSVDRRIGRLPRQTLIEFARFQLASIKDEDSPFREMIRTQDMVTCPLASGDGEYYVGDSGVNRFMRAIYGDAVCLYPLIIRDNIALAANFHPSDVGKLGPALELVRPTLAWTLDRHKRDLLTSAETLGTIKKFLERDYSKRSLDTTLFAVRNLPELVEIGNAALEACARMIGGWSSP